MLGGLTYWQMCDLMGYIRDNNKDVRIVDSTAPSYEMVFGVGNSETEFDHWYCERFESGYYEDWEDYRCPSPAKSEMDKLDEIATALRLPKPMLDSATWFDG